MDRRPNGWLDIMDPDRALAPLAGDPYFPEDLPMPPADSSEEEDPSEDEEEDPEEVEEPDDEGILEDAQMSDDDFGDVPQDDEDPEECLTDEEIPTPPSSPPRPSYQPHQTRGKCPLLLRTARQSVIPVSRLDTFSFTAPLSYDRAEKRTSGVLPRCEVGESSQAPPRVYPAQQDNGLAEKVRNLEELLRASNTASRAVERRVDGLETEEKEDSEAIQTLYHRMGATRTQVNTMSAQIRAPEYQSQVADSRLAAAEHRASVAEQEQRRLQEQFDELVRYLVTRLG